MDLNVGKQQQPPKYLGKITSMLGKVPQLEYVHTIAATELVMRSTKHIFTVYLQHLDMLRNHVKTHVKLLFKKKKLFLNIYIKTL